MNMRALAAEAIGTFGLVAAICGAGLFGASGDAASSVMATSLAAGLALTGLALALGPVSGGHFNPAVTLGLLAGGRFEASEALSYIVAQVIGGILAGLLLWVLLVLGPQGSGSLSQAANGFAPARTFGIWPVMLVETLFTALFVLVVAASTVRNGIGVMAPVAAGVVLAVLHIIAIPISNAGFNPARATGAAVFSDLQALTQLWVFWVCPILGGIAGGVTANWLTGE